MRLKHQWYVGMLLLVLASCASPAPVADVVSTATVVLPTVPPRHEDLIFVEFFAVT